MSFPAFAVKQALEVLSKKTWLDSIFSLNNKKAKVDGVNKSENYCCLECDAM